MHKTTKLGIPDSLLIALIFLAGLVDSVIMIGLAVYVLLFEREESVKQAAKIALMLFGLFAVLQGGLHTLDYLIRILLSNEAGYNNVYANFSYLLAASKTIAYLVMGLKEAGAYMASRGTGIYVPKEAETPAPAPAPAPTPAPAPAAAPEQQAPVANVCPKCGSPLDKGVHFCKKCGAKTN